MTVVNAANADVTLPTTSVVHPPSNSVTTPAANVLSPPSTSGVIPLVTPAARRIPSSTSTATPTIPVENQDLWHQEDSIDSLLVETYAVRSTVTN